MQPSAVNVLLADDQESDCVLFTDALKELEIKTIVHAFNDGVELMEYLTDENNPKSQLLFLDLNMPRKNGFESLKEIRSNHKLDNLVIVIISTSLSERDINETFDNGANFYITKPNNFEELKQLLNKVILNAHPYENLISNRANYILKI